MRHVANLLGDTDTAQLLRYMMAVQMKEPGVGAKLLQEGLERWPDSVPLLYAMAEQQVSEPIRGTALMGPVAAVARLPEAPAMVLNTARAAANQDWDTVSAADDRLAAVPWTAQWGLQAAQLRVEWRMRDRNPELRQRFGDEGIAIADRAEVSQPDVFWHALRARSASGTNRPEVMLESAAMFCATAESIRDKLADSERRLVRTRAVELGEVLQQLNGDVRVDADRVKAVQAALQKVVGLMR
jgi:hypothetical protein